MRVRPDFFSISSDDSWFKIAAYDGWVRLGSIEVARAEYGIDRPLSVSYVEVTPQHRRQGIATYLYEAAAQFACERYGLPLSSGFIREEEADAFWRKQVARGRAQYREYPGVLADYYTLTCPPPETLRNNPRRRRRGQTA